MDDATELLSSGGYMLYSTCTFAPEEDEENVKYIIGKGFEAVDIPLRDGEERGIGIEQARRIYPHNFDGEGHFYCVLKKTAKSVECELSNAKLKSKKVTVLGKTIDAKIVGETPAIVGFDLPSSGLRYRTVGVSVFERDERNRASYAFTHAMDGAQLKTSSTVELDEENAMRYIRGDQIEVDAPRGEVVVTHRGFALGLGKCAPDGAGSIVIKNLYPKHLRISK